MLDLAGRQSRHHPRDPVRLQKHLQPPQPLRVVRVCRLRVPLHVIHQRCLDDHLLHDRLVDLHHRHAVPPTMLEVPLLPVLTGRDSLLLAQPVQPRLLLPPHRQEIQGQSSPLCRLLHSTTTHHQLVHQPPLNLPHHLLTQVLLLRLPQLVSVTHRRAPSLPHSVINNHSTDPARTVQLDSAFPPPQPPPRPQSHPHQNHHLRRIHTTTPLTTHRRGAIVSSQSHPATAGVGLASRQGARTYLLLPSTSHLTNGNR